MDYLYYFDFCAWHKKIIFQKADIEAVPVVCFIPFSKISSGDVPLRYQFSITTQRWVKFSVANETLKCFRERVT